MATMKLPLSGDVSQFISPWSWFVRQAGQIGLFNINIGETPAPQVETQVLEDVGSYGRQIGRIADALDVLVGVLDRTSLTEEQAAAVFAFEAQLSAVRAVKARANLGPQPSLSSPPPRVRGEPKRPAPKPTDYRPAEATAAVTSPAEAPPAEAQPAAGDPAAALAAPARASAQRRVKRDGGEGPPPPAT